MDEAMADRAPSSNYAGASGFKEYAKKWGGLRCLLLFFQFGPASAKDELPMIQPNCRARFTAEDFDFVVRVLGRNPSQSVNLVDLLTDPEVRDQILDHEALSRAVLENPGNLVISPQFYFYILARLVGIFYENVESRWQRGAPSFSFYEELGRTSFHNAACHEVAKKFQLTAVFEKLADQFHDCRLALNRLADELFDLGDHRYAQPIISL